MKNQTSNRPSKKSTTYAVLDDRHKRQLSKALDTLTKACDTVSVKRTRERALNAIERLRQFESQFMPL